MTQAKRSPKIDQIMRQIKRMSVEDILELKHRLSTDLGWPPLDPAAVPAKPKDPQLVAPNAQRLE